METSTARDPVRDKMHKQSGLRARAISWLVDRSRIRPSFVIIGAQRSGTTSLYRYLCEHPLVVEAQRKEVHFFDTQYANGLGWYWKQFPSRFDSKFAGRRRLRLVTGEATPFYLFHPLAPQRLARALPQAKLIAILRNPIDRALSHYHHQIRRQHETLSFAEAIAAEEERLRGEREKIIRDGSYRSFPYQWFSYCARGRYAEQLDDWAKLFPRENLLVLIAEEFFDDPAASLARVIQWLGLPPMREATGGFAKYNLARYTDMDLGLRAQLADYFRPHNARLTSYLGAPPPWDH